MQMLTGGHPRCSHISDGVARTHNLAGADCGGACDHVGVEGRYKPPVDDVVDDDALPIVGPEVDGADDAVGDGGDGLSGVVGKVSTSMEGTAAGTWWWALTVRVADGTDREWPDN